MVLNILILIVGFIILIKGADFFVDGASSMAYNFKLSKTIIGLTIVALGTSLPEFAISISALARGKADISLGDVIGSNIINIMLILSIAAIIRPINIKENTLKKELPLIMLISTILVTLLLDVKLSNSAFNQITRSDGIIILLFFSTFIYYLITLMKKNDTSFKSAPHYSLFKSLILVLIGLIGIIMGSHFVVNSTSNIAKYIGISERLISLTIIAIGTSLPELVTSIVAAKKQEQEMLVGNIIGSNIINICVVLGIPVTIYGSIIPSSFLTRDIIMFIGSSILLFVFSITKKIITRLEGIIMLLIFVIYYLSIILIK